MYRIIREKTETAGIPRNQIRQVLHHMQREMLARALNTTADRLPAIFHGPQGKPYMPALPGFHYNFSDSGDWIVLAVSDQEIGIDLQRTVSTRYDVLRIAERFYTAEESHYLASLPEAVRSSEFFRLWSIKEAYLKYLGIGLAGGMNQYRIHPAASHTAASNGTDLVPRTLYSAPNGTILPDSSGTQKGLRQAAYHFCIPPEEDYFLCVVTHIHASETD